MMAPLTLDGLWAKYQKENSLLISVMVTNHGRNKIMEVTGSYHS